MRPVSWRTTHGDTVEVYEADDGVRYRVQAGNGEIVEQGSEAYESWDTAGEAAIRHHPVIGLLHPEYEAELEQAIARLTEALRGGGEKG